MSSINQRTNGLCGLLLLVACCLLPTAASAFVPEWRDSSGVASALPVDLFDVCADTTHTAQHHDGGLTLYFYGAADTEKGSWSAYCGNDPISSVDPLGLKSFEQIYGADVYAAALRGAGGDALKANFALAERWLSEKRTVINAAARAFGVPSQYLGAQLVLEAIPNVAWDKANAIDWPDNDWAEAYAVGDRSDATIAGREEYIAREIPSKRRARGYARAVSWGAGPLGRLAEAGIERAVYAYTAAAYVNGIGIGNVYWQSEWRKMKLAERIRSNDGVPIQIQGYARWIGEDKSRYNRAMYVSDDLSVYALAAALGWYAEEFQRRGITGSAGWDGKPTATFNAPAWGRNWHLPLFAKEQCGLRSKHFDLSRAWPYPETVEAPPGENVFGFERGGWVVGNIRYILRSLGEKP